jgi:hypothetical protein
MNIEELETLKRLNKEVISFVKNNHESFCNKFSVRYPMRDDCRDITINDDGCVVLCSYGGGFFYVGLDKVFKWMNEVEK